MNSYLLNVFAVIGVGAVFIGIFLAILVAGGAISINTQWHDGDDK